MDAARADSGNRSLRAALATAFTMLGTKSSVHRVLHLWGSYRIKLSSWVRACRELRGNGVGASFGIRSPG